MFELSQDHEDFRTGRPRLRREGGRAAHRQVGRRRTLPDRPRAARWVTSGSSASSCRRSTAAPGRGDFTSLCVAIEELGRVDQSIGITLSAGRGSRHQPDPHLRHRGAEAALPARPRGRPRPRRLRPHRARGRLRRRGHPHQGRSGDGDEWVVDGAKAFITNSGTDITSVVTVTARTGTHDDGSPQISRDPGARRHPGVHRRARLPQARLARLRHPRPHLRGLPGAGRPPARRARARASSSSSRPSTTAASRSRRSPSGCAQACLELATDYAKTRTAFGRPIGVNQGISFQVADLAVMVEAARLLTYKAAWLKDELHAGRRSSPRSSRPPRSPSSTRPRPP